MNSLADVPGRGGGIGGCDDVMKITVESTEGISEIWFCDPFPPWGVHTFGVMVRFTYG